MIIIIIIVIKRKIRKKKWDVVKKIVAFCYSFSLTHSWSRHLDGRGETGRVRQRDDRCVCAVLGREGADLWEGDEAWKVWEKD